MVQIFNKHKTKEFDNSFSKETNIRDYNSMLITYVNPILNPHYPLNPT